MSRNDFPPVLANRERPQAVDGRPQSAQRLVREARRSQSLCEGLLSVNRRRSPDPHSDGGCREALDPDPQSRRQAQRTLCRGAVSMTHHRPPGRRSGDRRAALDLRLQLALHAVREARQLEHRHRGDRLSENHHRPPGRHSDRNRRVTLDLRQPTRHPVHAGRDVAGRLQQPVRHTGRGSRTASNRPGSLRSRPRSAVVGFPCRAFPSCLRTRSLRDTPSLSSPCAHLESP